MATVTQQAGPAWTIGFRTNEDETVEPTAVEVEGALPPDLSGVLYRVGPARHEVFGDRYPHWFDGDGMVHALHLDGGMSGVQATYQGRFVATEGKKAEDAAGRRLFGGGFYGPPPGGPITRLRHALPKNTANINVVPFGGRPLPPWERGRPSPPRPDTPQKRGRD